MLKVLWRNEREKLGKGDKSGLDRMTREDFIEKGTHFVSYINVLSLHLKHNVC